MKKDSKWSILILAAGTFTVFSEMGILKGFSVLLPTLKKQFSTQTWVIGSSISIIYGWGYSLGLSANMLKKRFGARWSIMLCGLLSSTGMIIVAVANDMYTFLVGILLFGFMLAQENVALGVVPDYFDKYYNVAVSVHTLGAATAVMVFAPTTEFLLDIYGWRGTMLLFCGLSLHTLPFGALFETRQETTHTAYKTGSADSVKENEPTFAIWERLKTLLKEFDGPLITSLPFICRVIIPSIVWNYTFSGWAIYIVSYALSFGSSLKEASIVSTFGGIGMVAIRIVLPVLSMTIPYRQLMYISSILMTLGMVLTTLFHSIAFLCASSLIFGVGLGLLGPLTYVAVKDVTSDDQYVNGVAWFHLVAGFAMIVGATITGAIFDATTSFIISFFILSAVSFGTFLSLGFEDIWMRLNIRKSAPL